jgi:sporulation integral membrane protein YtvI
LSIKTDHSLLLLIRTALIVLIGAAIYFFAEYLWPLLASLLGGAIKVTLPFIIAYLVGTILNPAVVHLEKRYKLNRTWGTLLTLLIFTGLLGSFIYLLLSSMIRESMQLYHQLNLYSANLGLRNLDLLVDRLQQLLLSLHLPGNMVQEALNNLISLLKDSIGSGLSSLIVLVTSLPRYFLLLVITVVAAYFFARDYQMIGTGVLRLTPERWRPAVGKVGTGLHKALHGYIKAELMLVTITGLISLIGLVILGVDYAHILAILVALADLLPILGPGTIFLPWGVWMIFSGNLKLGIGLLVLYGIIVVVRQLLEPKILGDNIGLHPLTTLIALYLGLSLLGIWGLIIGPAVVIAYQAFTSE